MSSIAEAAALETYRTTIERYARARAALSDVLAARDAYESTVRADPRSRPALHLAEIITPLED